MIVRLQKLLLDVRIITRIVAVFVILGAIVLGFSVSFRWLALILMGIGVVVLMQHPRLALMAVIPAALIARIDLNTGTEVVLNFATVLIPVSLALWLLECMRSGQFTVPPSRVHLPLVCFVAAGLLSLFLGSVFWDPAVPRSGSFIIVQLAQWSIFAFSAGAFWLMVDWGRDEGWLRRMVFLYISVAGITAILYVTAGGVQLVLSRVLTVAVRRAPFWMLLAAVTSGQLLFNDKLNTSQRCSLVVVLAAVAFAVFRVERATASHWVGVATVLAAMAWLRWTRMRWLAILMLVILTATGILSSAVYDFAGGEEEWIESGGSRLVLINRVIDVTMRNPITGIGPAAYRAYARTEPLLYYGALWFSPSVSAHNNYVDLFSHVGLLGIGIFIWFSVEVTRLGFALRKRYTRGFAAGYVNAMIAAWAGALVLMLFADWILPFVYNIGFPGFQASVLVWLFLGGLVALEHMPSSGVEDVDAFSQRAGGVIRLIDPSGNEA